MNIFEPPLKMSFLVMATVLLLLGISISTIEGTSLHSPYDSGETSYPSSASTFGTPFRNYQMPLTRNERIYKQTVIPSYSIKSSDKLIMISQFDQLPDTMAYP